ncbi:unnamed protein product [Closterium sp. Naga37s-1]|nr:unnamed protein product [Closterium sp. Naga37s-1]
MRRRRTLRARRRGGKEAALQQRCSVEWSGIMRHEEETDTSGKERARRQGGGTSAEVCSVVGGHFGQGGAEEAAVQQGAGAEARRWHFRRTGERGGMTHGQQPLACGCLLLALLTTCSRQGGHLGQGGKHGTLGARGKKDTWGKEEEATRRHFRTEGRAAAWRGVNAPAQGGHFRRGVEEAALQVRSRGGDTSGEDRGGGTSVEEAALQVRSGGGGASGEESRRRRFRRTGERGGMTHGRQPLACGCLLLALLTTRSRQGGHLGQGGKHATLGARGKGDTWGKEEEATRRHFSKERGAAAWTGVNTVTDTVSLCFGRTAGEQQQGGESTPSPTLTAGEQQQGGESTPSPTLTTGEQQQGGESTPSPTLTAGEQQQGGESTPSLRRRSSFLVRSRAERGGAEQQSRGASRQPSARQEMQQRWRGAAGAEEQEQSPLLFSVFVSSISLLFVTCPSGLCFLNSASSITQEMQQRRRGAAGAEEQEQSSLLFSGDAAEAARSSGSGGTGAVASALLCFREFNFPTFLYLSVLTLFPKFCLFHYTRDAAEAARSSGSGGTGAVASALHCFRELNFPTFRHLSVWTLFPEFCLFHYTGDAAEAARSSGSGGTGAVASALLWLICTTCVGSTEDPQLWHQVVPHEGSPPQRGVWV